MRLIRSVRVEGFRSIQAAELPELTAFTAFVGRNSSGKSNFLRALNLFFNNEVGPGQSLVFSSDVYDEEPRIKKKKLICISVDFAVPTNFRFRKELEPLKVLGGTFSISRTWEINAQRQIVEDIRMTANDELVPNGGQLARQFLGLVTFRYIPNRSVPAQLLRTESQSIANAIFRRMRGGQQGDELLKALGEAAARLLEDAAKNLEASGSPLVQPSVATAATIGDMLSMSGFQAVGAHGRFVRDEDWGAGHQSFFLYELLRAIDTNISHTFGWRQAAVWGVEEPESGLHRDLETRLAEQLRSWALDDGSRLQVLESTHSPILTMAADSGYWVELDGKRSSFKKQSIPELTRSAELRGVSGWVHPVLSFPWNPVVLVEGEIDAKVLIHVSRIAGLLEMQFLPLPTLDPSEHSGGADQMVRYIRTHGGLLRNRPKTAPLIALFDWEVSAEKLAQARQGYGGAGTQYVVQMNVAHCDPKLGPTFRGIERFYPPRIIAEAHHADELVVGMKEGRPYAVAASELVRGKNRLANRLLQVDQLKELEPLVKVLLDIDRAVRGHSGLQLTLPGFAESGKSEPVQGA